MKRLSLIALLGLLLFVSCEHKNGGEQTFQSVECDPPLDWLEQFIPLPDIVQGGARKMPPPQDPAPTPYYDAYQYSDFLRITVPSADSIQLMHHFAVPCAYSVKGCVVLRDGVIELSEEKRKPLGIIQPCICGTTITTAVHTSHLDYSSIFLPEYDLTFPLHLYEGLDTLIMIYTDVPAEPVTMLLLEGEVVNQNDHGLPDVEVILENQAGTLLKTIYTGENGYFFEHLTFDISESDTLSVIALDPYYNYYDTTKVAFADMYIDYDAWNMYYQADVKIQLRKK